MKRFFTRGKARLKRGDKPSRGPIDPATRARWRNLILFGAAALLIAALAFVLRVVPIQISHWWDEAVYLQHSEVLFSGRTNYDEFHFRPPMLSILIAASYLFQHSAVAAGVLTALLGALGSLFFYLLGKEVYGATAGVLAALFCAIAPFFITASHWIRPDIPALTFVAIAFYLLVIAARRQSDALFVVSGFFYALAGLTSFEALSVALVYPLFAAVMGVSWKRLGLAAAGAAVPLVPYFVWAQIHFGSALAPLVGAYRSVSDPVGDLSFYGRHFLEVYPAVILAGLFVYAVMLFSVLRPVVRREESEVLFGVRLNVRSLFGESLRTIDFVLMLWGVLFFLGLSVIRHRDPLYLLLLAVPVLLLGAKGYTQMWERGRGWAYGSAILLVLLLVPASSEAVSRLRGPAFNRQVTEPVSHSRFLVSLKRPGAVIYANHDYPVYAYYTGMPTIVVPGDQNFYTAAAEAMKEKGFFIYYKAIGKQPRAGWLESQPRFRKIREGREVAVYEFTP
jgi:4-amino-4-deoxy-L-arabinose transferase-like glycosyltransferase